ncbi:hypothetical protein QR680_000400 [Steinernema hermaphroditum]|uniref:Uncharacterized protein n=1 Tax=Steinernema hermaphroditum TaxID=289476 RepID=A0AA39LE13_9BILA|nr:hypothetical protein QR680_000400 [Steinernema hermaphroditum]
MFDTRSPTQDRQQKRNQQVTKLITTRPNRCGIESAVEKWTVIIGRPRKAAAFYLSDSGSVWPNDRREILSAFGGPHSAADTLC